VRSLDRPKRRPGLPYFRVRVGGALFAAAALFAGSMVRAQTYTVLHSFTGADGAQPQGGVIQASDGYFYGTTSAGGASGEGTVFRMDTFGNVTTLHSFSGPDGAQPLAGVIQGTDGNLYGTASIGGPGEGNPSPDISFGTVFTIAVSGNFATLHSFTYNDGAGPGGLIKGSDGSFYGVTAGGGVSGAGVIFKIDATGNFSALHTFSGPDGAHPSGNLLEASDGNFYGPAKEGGATGNGVIFKMDPSGNVTTFHSFGGGTGPDGTSPWGALIQGTDGNFYGTTNVGGANACQGNGCGTVYKLDASGNVTLLHSFSMTDGDFPPAGLVQASDGNFYGTTTYFGPAGDFDYGTIFRINAAGNFATLHAFTGTDGTPSSGPLMQGRDGSLYGTASEGGGTGGGAVFKFTPLAPGHCIADAETLCLNNGRFEVRSTWTDFQGNQGSGNVVPGVSSSDSGLFWFFGPTNWEILIKVLNGCGVNSHYWVFGAASTNVQYTIQVTDTVTGAVNYYTNPLGTSSPAITDTAAFASCP
jgi:uncharacterized repeat protein (TIGR03803 family)